MFNQLKDIRESKNLSKIEVANKIGSNDVLIARVETGEMDIRLKDAARLAYIYNVTLDDIYIAINKKSNINTTRI